MIDTTLAPTPETTPVPETKEEYLYTTKKGKIKKFRTKEAYDNYLKRLEKLKVAGRSGGRPPNELEHKSDTMQSGEGSSTSNSALQILTNDEEKKRIESEKKTTDTTASHHNRTPDHQHRTPDNSPILSGTASTVSYGMLEVSCLQSLRGWTHHP